jgi:hypothetical protein
MNQQSHDQPGLAQPGPAQRDPGHQGSAQQVPAQNGGVEQRDSQQTDSQRGEAPDTSHSSHQVKPQGGEPAGNAALASNTAAGAKRTGAKNEAVAGPFTVRDLTVFAATLVLFVASLIPMFALRYNLWNLGSLFFLGLGIVLPLIVAALFVARRLAPETKVRIGSLSIDQFGSVVASFAVAFFFLSIAGAFTPSLLVALIGSLVLLATTVLAPFIPFFAGDFLDRAEVPAHVMARESAVPVQKPKAPKAPKPAKPSDAKPVDARPSVQDSSVQGSSVQGPTAGGQYAAGQTFGASPVTGSHDTSTAAGVAAPSPAAWSAANAAAASTETQAAAVVPSAEASAAEASAAERPAAAEAAFPAAEETRLDGTPVNGTPANGAAAAAGATPAASAAQAASATPATAVHPQVKAQEPVKSQEPIGATVDPASRPEETEQPPAHEAFWFAVAQHRTAVDERTGAPLFGIEPGGWVLALEDRGDEFLVQHTDGRVGVLRDLSNIERG